jgi:predicted DNA-binding transcriptional regulator AlpA
LPLLANVRYLATVDPLLIDTVEVSRLTGFPRETLVYWRRTGDGPRWAKIGRRVVYRPEDVRSWIDSHYPDPPAGPRADEPDAPTTPTPTEA